MAELSNKSLKPADVIEYHITLMTMVIDVCNVVGEIAHDLATNVQDNPGRETLLLSLAHKADEIRDFANAFELPKGVT